MTEQYDLRHLQPLVDIIDRSGGKLEIKQRVRRSPEFSEMVIRPARFYMTLGFLAMFTLCLAFIVMLRIYSEWIAWLVAVLFSLSAGLSSYFWKANSLEYTWLEMMRPRSEITAEANHFPPDTKPMVKTGKTIKLSRYEFWRRNGLERLRKRAIEGQWKEGDRLTRKMLTGCITNVTGNFRPACDELVDWEWLGFEGDAYYWTDKGLKELRDYE